MPPTPAARLQTLFAAALELPESEREAFLLRECTSESDMLIELRHLLAMDRHLADKTLRAMTPVLTQLVSTTAPVQSLTGLRVGAFQLGEELGRGGMGSVYRGERVDGSVNQQVAIKFVRRELLDANTLGRFQMERQTLASLDHPNIAHLIDAAELEDGTPYFVMEYVDGTPITEHCVNVKLDVRERIKLFRTVCAAVMHAHRNLVVHRDLKPSNILVSAAGVPKLLDFGIAKPLTPGVDALEVEQTGTAQRFFSPQYSAPEQLLGGTIGVGCDVYALGLLLYELLADTRPFDFTGLSSGQIERLVTTVPPITPSAAAQRSGASAQRQRQLRGDLDGIVSRCLRKSANERYASVEQLDSDLDNYLEGRPVQARGGHGWYRTQKFVRRNLVAVSASLITATALTIGIIGFAWQARIANQRAAELEQVVKFQVEMLAQAEPNRAGQLLSRDVANMLEKSLVESGVAKSDRLAQTSAFANGWQRVNATDAARNLIDSTIFKPAVAAIYKQFTHQPLVDAALRQTLADAYSRLGLFDAAFPLQQHVLVTRRKMLAGNDPELLSSVHSMGVLLHMRADLAGSETFLREALDGRRLRLGEDAPETLESMHEFGVLLVSQGKQAEAESYYRQALTKRRQVLGEEHPDTLRSINNMGTLYMDMGKLADAEPYLRVVFEAARRTLPEHDLLRITSIHNMGQLLRTQGKLTEAEHYVREAVAKRRLLLGRDHPDTQVSIGLLSIVLQEQDKLAEAEPYTREVLASRRKTLGNDHVYTLLSILNMGSLLRRQNKLREAEPLFREAILKSRPEAGLDPFVTCVSIYKLGDVLQAQGNYTEASEILSPAEGDMRKLFTGDNASRLANYLVALGRTRFGLKQYSAAEPLLLEAEEIYRKFPGPYEKDKRESIQALIDLYLAWNKDAPEHGYNSKASEWKQKTL
jgi:eukaryotic-like serine/threonine-protein kinase